MSAGDRMAALLAHEGLALAAGALLGGVAAAGAGLGWPAPAWGLAALAGAILAAGSATHLAALSRARTRHPPPGRLVDLGGYRVHVRAEGEVHGAWPIVLFGGGHASGLAMEPLHRVLKLGTRSILIDRPGTGWSDTGPFPRSTAREAEEMWAALDAAGERGPVVLAGYSFGGLLAANMARRRPERVARLVLLDATPLETLVFGPQLGAIGRMRRDAFCTGLARLVGLPIDFAERRARAHPAHRESREAYERAMGPAVLAAHRGVEVSAGARFADWSILRELKGPHIGRIGWSTVVYDGDLGDLDTWLVAPGDAREVTAEREIGAAAQAEQARMLRFYAASRERYLAASSRTRRIVTPEGTTHQFVYQRPDFVVDVLSEAVRRPDAARGRALAGRRAEQ